MFELRLTKCTIDNSLKSNKVSKKKKITTLNTSSTDSCQFNTRSQAFGEEKEYKRDGKSNKMIAIELSSKKYFMF